jgi:hypothetical protein
MRRATMAKPSEFGGSDTDKTLGIQPAPHKLEGYEKLRLMYAEDPMQEVTTVRPELEEE